MQDIDFMTVKEFAKKHNKTRQWINVLIMRKDPRIEIKQIGKRVFVLPESTYPELNTNAKS